MTTKTMIPAFALVGAFLLGSLGLAQASDNPFAAESAVPGTMQLAGAEDKCGGETGGESKCGGDSKCGADSGAGGKCGSDEDMEGKCGAGKCGGE